MLMDGKVAIKGVPQRDIALGALAALANPLRGAVQPRTEPGLEATTYFGRAKDATAAGAHAIIVDIDPAIMGLRILKYVVAHDCGTVINPLIVAGQVQGGVAQGIGNAFTSGWSSTSKDSSSTAPSPIICCRPQPKCQ